MWRAGLFALAWTVLSGLGLLHLVPSRPLLAVNRSSSLPQGVYGLRTTAPVTHGSLVVVRPTAAQAAFLEARGYLHPSMPLLKPVVALAGDTVCCDTTVRVNGMVLGPGPQSVDHQGRPLPQWQGCTVLHPGELFLLSTYSLDSLDSRYLGPVRQEAVLATATLLWRW
jgi:conjugative transfer signal peptidase TraF